MGIHIELEAAERSSQPCHHSPSALALGWPANCLHAPPQLHLLRLLLHRQWALVPESGPTAKNAPTQKLAAHKVLPDSAAESCETLAWPSCDCQRARWSMQLQPVGLQALRVARLEHVSAQRLQTCSTLLAAALLTAQPTHTGSCVAFTEVH